MQAGNYNKTIVLFDGVCVLCSNIVRFIINYDKKDKFRFAAIQSEPGANLAGDRNKPVGDPGTVILIEKGKYYYRSAAVLRILKNLSGGWPLLYALIIIPAPVRDFFYTFVANKRYRWFGRYDECLMPDASIRKKFIERTPGLN